MAPVSHIINHHGIKYHIYADDIQLYVDYDRNHFAHAKKKLEDCVSDIFVWMSNNKLAINANKTELIQFSTRPEQQINVHIGQLTYQLHLVSEVLGCTLMKS